MNPLMEERPLRRAGAHARFAFRTSAGMLLLLIAGTLGGCSSGRRDPQTVTVLIENSPTSLDPRIGVDAQAEHIDPLIFDSLVHRDAHFNLQPWLATRWETPDPLTYIFHLRGQVHFQNGKLLTASDVKWTLDSMRDGTVLTAKSSALAKIDRVEAADPATVVIHLKQPDAALLWNLSDGAIGIVPEGSGRNFGFHPIGTGPFRFVSQQADTDVILERSVNSWQPAPAIERIRFAVVPDAITRALELEKGSADACINCMTSDMVTALSRRPNLVVESAPGTSLNYISFNTQDPVLRDVRVRQAIAYAINRPLIIHSLWRDRARLAASLLPGQHWAWNGNVEQYPYDPARANALLDQAGWKRGKDGIRFSLAMKTSTDETARLLALILQQQLREIGIALEVRSFEFATFYSDVTKGAFQMYTLRWIGGNEDPDIFRYSYATSAFPPRGANRGRFSNRRLDELIAEAGASSDQQQRRADYAIVQQILAAELPSINLWYLDTVMVHTRRLTGVQLSSSGNFDFLKYARLQTG
ncbi:MAG TPA: ABC transporter substrate-binding protein [Acidobacteriaceae bacterium]|nr:ABC transporter substrate-binding protein [Acidobacteriaceae bacterium]